jgi:hypothetical protein
MNNRDTIALPLIATGWFSRVRHSLLRRRQMRSLAAAIRRGAFVAVPAR